MNNIKKMLEKASLIAVKNMGKKHHFFGAIGIRSDGAMVNACNGSPRYAPIYSHHCEARLCRKLDAGSIVFLSRIRSNGLWAISKPCPHCEKILRQKGVKRIYYTIKQNEYGVLNF